MAQYIRIHELNAYVRQLLEQSEPLSQLIVCGEVSNFTRHYKSGHLYFTLKDETASVKAVMFRDKARLLGFQPQNGMQVLAYGRATLYERDGAFQIYVDFMRPFGAGAAQMAFDALRKKLEAEGLFAPEHKRPLPAMPRCIGVVTSKTGAALQDVCHVITRRWPLTRLLLAPVSVQGLEAEQSIVDGIRALDADARPEVILVTRGGGSKEDLWVFNSERIARAAYGCRKPVVSAVGHEIDYTILDYVADVRAPTPSAAAELCVPDRRQVIQELCSFRQNIQSSIQSRLQLCYNKMDGLGAGTVLRGFHTGMQARAQLTDRLASDIGAQTQALWQRRRQRLQSAAALASSLDPYRVLARGYALVQDGKGECLRVESLQPGETIRLRGAAAQADCTVRSVMPMAGEEHHENTQEL
ncbi:MAG TPA: exodeoxyribonuclease VII large subunit [Candidatus Gemmiger stercoravium]|nr:exodeoxyribonuclease VII large subunit [Candidatus Gemmiger stercoravium]